MKHLELHIIHPVPISCLNRDDLNSPKTAMIGGVQRARASKQSWARAIREMCAELTPELYKGQRTKLIYLPILEALQERGLPENDAVEGAKAIADAIGKLDAKQPDPVKVSTMFFMSPLEIKAMANAYVESKDAKKAIKSIDASMRRDAADISLFGRMVASDHSLTVEAAAMFNHAFSTHKVTNETDFFTAVDDLQSDDIAGAGMTGTTEFNSATYYRFTALNLDMLFDNAHLASLASSERKVVVRSFVESVIKAMPSAKDKAMNAYTLPSYILGVIRQKGHPIQLANAFEEAVRAKDGMGYAARSEELLKAEYKKLKETYGLNAMYEKAIPEVKMAEFLEGICAHVS